jgi:hypothetical protein
MMVDAGSSICVSGERRDSVTVYPLGVLPTPSVPLHSIYLLPDGMSFFVFFVFIFRDGMTGNLEAPDGEADYEHA